MGMERMEAIPQVTALIPVKSLRTPAKIPPKIPPTSKRVDKSPLSLSLRPKPEVNDWLTRNRWRAAMIYRPDSLM